MTHPLADLGPIPQPVAQRWRGPRELPAWLLKVLPWRALEWISRRDTCWGNLAAAKTLARFDWEPIDLQPPCKRDAEGYCDYCGHRRKAP